MSQIYDGIVVFEYLPLQDFGGNSPILLLINQKRVHSFSDN